MHRFVEENRSLLEHKVVKNFLKSKDNRQLLVNAICNPSEKNYELVDLSFKKYNFNARFTAYISTTLYFYALNYDKNQRKDNERCSLTIDQPIKEYGGATLKDLLENSTTQLSLDEIIDSEHIEDYVEWSTLYQAIANLSTKQKEVIDLYYVSNLSEKDIGVLLKKTQQVVSKLHRKALLNIFNYIQRKGGI